MRMEKKQTSRILKTLKSWKIHSGYWLKLAVIIGLFSGFCLIAQAWILAKLVNAVVFQGATLSSVMPWLWVMLGIFLFRAFLAWAAEQAAFYAAIQVKLSLRKQLYRQLQKLGPAWLSGERSGDIVNSLSDGIEALEAYYARFLPAMSLVALIPFAILVFVFPSDWISALIMLATAPLIPLFMILIGYGTEKRNQKQWKQLARMSAHLLDVIQGLTTLKLFNASQREAKVVATLSNDYRLGTMSVLRVAFLSSLALEFFASVSIALVAVVIGFRLFYGDMDFFYGFFVLLLAPEFYFPLRNMGTQYHARMEAIGAAERMIDILNTKIDSNNGTQENIPALDQSPIRFQNVSFTYPDGRKALDHFNLEIQANETLALVGASGSGKTTLINCLMGFLKPTTGDIIIGDTALSEISQAHWRQQLAWLPQKPQIFPASVADNIRLGQDQASIAAIKQAAQQAHANEFIDELSNTYDTLIGEAGQTLSGGHVQRIALARAFLKDAPLIILDEATANLDMQSEAKVQAAINTLAQNRTVIMIAHRLRTIQKADRIAVIDKGRLVAVGTHTELLEHSSHYREMIHASQHDQEATK